MHNIYPTDLLKARNFAAYVINILLHEQLIYRLLIIMSMSNIFDFSDDTILIC